MEIVGYCYIKKGATTCTGAKDPSQFIGKTLRVMEFADDGGVLVVNNEGTALAMFDKEDVYRKFECMVSGGVIMPPKLNMFEQMAYSHKCMSRKGGYAPILANMVIQISLMKGEFTDNLLWQKQ